MIIYIENVYTDVSTSDVGGGKTLGGGGIQKLKSQPKGLPDGVGVQTNSCDMGKDGGGS